MIQLANGATVHAAYIIPKSEGLKDRGCVLAETPTDWVCWNIYWDGKTTMHTDSSVRMGMQHHEVWEAENGHYFQKESYQEGEAKALASQQFTRQMTQFMTSDMTDAIWRSHQRD